MTALYWLPDETMSMVQAALVYAAHGLRVFPVGADRKPLVPTGFKAATTDRNTIAAWWKRWPGAGIGWAVQAPFFVLDVDPRHQGHVSLEELERLHERLPLTLSQTTPRGGRHLVFRVPDRIEVKQGAGKLGAGLDTRAPDKGYIVLPNSPHNLSKLRYAWKDRVPAAQIPAWLLDLVRVRPVVPPELVRPLAESIANQRASQDSDRSRRYAVAALQGEALAVAHTPKGGRNHRLIAAWYRCTRDADVAPFLDRDLVRAELTRAALAAGLPEHEIRRTLRDETRRAA